MVAGCKDERSSGLSLVIGFVIGGVRLWVLPSES